MKASRLALVTIILLCAASVAWEFYQLPDASDRLAELEINGVGYRSRGLPLSPTEANHYQKANAQKRLCQVNGQSFVMIMIDGTHDRHAVHDPMFCFRGQGWSVDCLQEKEIARGQAQYARLTRNGETAEVYYWFGDGKYRYTKPTQYWLDTVLRRITFGCSGDEPVLVLLQPVGERPIDWHRVFESPFLEPL